MRRPFLSLAAMLSVGIALGAPGATQAQDAFRVVDNPGGGHVAYATSGAPTPADAMGSALHYVHRQFGDRPNAGGVFRSRDGHNYGCFFTVKEKDGHGQPIAGLVIVSLAQGAQSAVAVLYDDAGRFARTEPQLLHALTEAWRKAAAGTVAVAALNQTPFPDGSGSVRLPAGWRITFASHGAARIVGPQGELVLLGNSAGPIYDSNNPQVQARLRYAPANSRPILCPVADPVRTYLCVVQHGLGQPPLFEVRQSREIHPPQGRAVQQVLVDADIDVHDGKGTMACELGLGVTAVGPMGDRTLGINGTCAPKAGAAQVQPTLKAIYDSYAINDRVVTGEYAADANRSRMAGAAARDQANAAHAAEDARSAAFQAHMDNIDRFSRSFENYQLDQTELQDSDRRERAAVPNALADALVRANPDRFQTVPTADFLKGVDF